MKKKFLFLITVLAGVGTVMADEVTADNLTVPIGGQATLAVKFQFDVAEQYCGWQFSLVLPEGVATVKDAKGNPVFTTGDSYDSSYTFSSSTDGETDDFVALSLQSTPMIGTTGTLISIPISCADNLTVGDIYNATLKGIQLGNVDGVHTTFIDDVVFTITIGEPADTRVVLDENSTTVPQASAEPVDVRVLRTIKADEWSTICLPFAMTEEQVKESFGSDVQLADFIGAESEFDVADNVVGIKVGFEGSSTIEANHPYIIKVSQSVSEFTVNGVDVVPDEEAAIIEFDNGRTGSRRVVYSGFYGMYHAGTVLDKNMLFLNAGKFWYSSGETKMKAFRAYFDFLDVLTEVEEAGVKILAVIDGMATSIGSLAPALPLGEEATYNLAGQRVGKSYKGIVVENGRKTIK